MQEKNEDKDEKNENSNQFNKQIEGQLQQISEEQYFANKSRVRNYRIMKYLDKGGTGIIKLCQRYQDQNSLYVMKIYKQGTSQDIDREITALQKLHHPKIINMIEFFKEETYITKHQIQYKATIVILQYCENGCPFEYIRYSKFQKPSIIRKLFLDFLDGLEYIHQTGLAHRDVKVENLLFDKGFNLLINDFGFSEQISKYKNNKFRTNLGSNVHKGPEFYFKEVCYNGVKADIFAAGVTLFILQLGTDPFEIAVKEQDQYFKFLVKNNEVFWQNHIQNCKKKLHMHNPENLITEEFKDLINGMLKFNAKERLTIQEIREHSWFKNQIIASQQEVFETLTALKPNVDKYRKSQIKRDPNDYDLDDNGFDKNDLSEFEIKKQEQNNKQKKKQNNKQQQSIIQNTKEKEEQQEQQQNNQQQEESQNKIEQNDNSNQLQQQQDEQCNTDESLKNFPIGQFRSQFVEQGKQNSIETGIQELEQKYNLYQQSERVLIQVDVKIRNCFNISIQNPQHALLLSIYSLTKMYQDKDNILLAIMNNKISQKTYKFQFEVNNNMKMHLIEIKIYKDYQSQNLVVEMLRREGNFQAFLEIFDNFKEMMLDSIFFSNQK